jgi:exopolysaccharide biosynthesis operon protein EpsL
MKGRTTAAFVMMGYCTLAPAQSTQQAVQSIDQLNWPDDGKFLAYPAEPDERRFRFSVFGGLEQDNNPFRLSDSVNPQTVLGSSEKSDTLRRGGIGLKADLPQSRQRFLIDVAAELNDYSRFSVLDHTAYRAIGTWKWRAGPNWSGDIGYGRRRFLASLSEIQAPIKDLITEDRAFGTSNVMVTPRWRVRGEADYTRWDHGEATREALDARIWSATGGLDYVTPQGNSVGGQIKYTDGEYPNRQVVPGGTVDNQFEEYEASVVMRYGVTGKSTLYGRAGYTNRWHEQVTERNFDGFTGRLDYDWFVGPKTLLGFSAWREIRSTEDLSASYVLATGWAVGPGWAPTSKLLVQARYIREDLEYSGDPGFVISGTPPREDTFRGLQLFGGYAPQRNIRLSIGLKIGDRESNAVSREYDYQAISANAKVQF